MWLHDELYHLPVLVTLATTGDFRRLLIWEKLAIFEKTGILTKQLLRRQNLFENQVTGNKLFDIGLSPRFVHNLLLS